MVASVKPPTTAPPTPPTTAPTGPPTTAPPTAPAVAPAATPAWAYAAAGITSASIAAPVMIRIRVSNLLFVLANTCDQAFALAQKITRFGQGGSANGHARAKRNIRRLAMTVR